MDVSYLLDSWHTPMFVMLPELYLFYHESERQIDMSAKA